MIKRITISFLVVVFLFACDEKKQETKHSNVDIKQPKIFVNLENELDTILEENNPRSINLDKHQLFIDTARTSSFYKSIRDFAIETSKNRNKQIHQRGDELLKKIAQINFPKKFIKIRKVERNYILYDRCDGSEPVYEIKDATLIYHGVHESLVAAITDIREVDKNRLEAELILPFRENISKSNVGSLVIDRTTEKSIYEVSIRSELANFQDYVINIEEIDNHDLLVNNCPQAKVIEYNDFEKISLPKLYNDNSPNKSSKYLSEPPVSGRYVYEIAFAEWQEKSLGDKVEVIIEGYEIKVICLDVNIGDLKKGDVIDEGFIMKHKSGQWIISKDKSSVNLEEVGGCIAGPAIIDFVNKKYVMC